MNVKGQLCWVSSPLLPLHEFWRSNSDCQIWEANTCTHAAVSLASLICVHVFVFYMQREREICIRGWPQTCSHIPASTFQALRFEAAWICTLFSLTHRGNKLGNRSLATGFKGFKFGTIAATVILPIFWSQFNQQDRVIAYKK